MPPTEWHFLTDEMGSAATSGKWREGTARGSPRHRGSILRDSDIGRPPFGLTLAKRLIVVAILAVIMTQELPAYPNYAVRMKISKALSELIAAKTAVISACGSGSTNAAIHAPLTDYRFPAIKLDRSFVAHFKRAGSCAGPNIPITTRNTGVSPDPSFILPGKISSRPNRIIWHCSSSATEEWLLPRSCRS
jgi:Tfp pilus assembly major pilin PilA